MGGLPSRIRMMDTVTQDRPVVIVEVISESNSANR